MFTGKINIHLRSICTIRCERFPSRNSSTDSVLRRSLYCPFCFNVMGFDLSETEGSSGAQVDDWDFVGHVHPSYHGEFYRLLILANQISLSLPAYQRQFYANNTGIYSVPKRARWTSRLLQQALQLYSTFRKHVIRGPDPGR